MKIQIAQKLRPFSHVAGAACLIPGTDWKIEAFPTLLRLGEGKIEVKLHITGPVEGFTLQQDLEKNCVVVFGKAKEGYYHLRLEAHDSGFDLCVERAPAAGIAFEGSARGRLKTKDRVHFPCEIQFALKNSVERLSLGSHKAQDWEAVQRRSDLAEILPVLFCLGQKIPSVLPQPLRGPGRLLELPTDRAALAPALQAFFKAAFKQILIPRLLDDQHQGLAPEESVEGNPLFFLQEGAKLTRSLFFQQNERRLQWLPSLPIPLHCGRMTGIIAKGVGELDFEWSKKLLSSVILRAQTSGDIVLELQHELKSFRIRCSLQDKGRRQNSSEPLLLEAGKTYFLDRFQK